MPLTTSAKPPIAFTSKPLAARPTSGLAPVAKRRWNVPPADLFPSTATPRVSSASSKRTDKSIATTHKHLSEVGAAKPTHEPREQFRAAIATASVPTSAGRRDSRKDSLVNSKLEDAAVKTGTKEPPSVMATPPPTRRSSQSARIRRTNEERQPLISKADTVDPSEKLNANSLRADPKRQQLVARAAELSAMQSARRQDSLHGAQVLKSLRRQDVEADDVSPLIEICYWSPFVEVRRDAAAAIASLSRNSANLELLDQVGTLGAILTMLSSPVDRDDSGISHDCAQALAALVRLSTIKTKLLQAPGGIDCVFSLLHTATDHKLRLVGFEVVARLVTIDEWREAVAKREGFAFMLNCCSDSGVSQSSRNAWANDTRTRTLAASILHQLAASCDNRVLFYHSGHFTTLSGLLRDPFLDKDAIFRRELLSFVHLLLTEAENASRFASLGLLPCVLSVLGRGSSCASKPSLQVALLVVAILDVVAKNTANHEALVQAETMPRLVQLCFSSTSLSATNPDKKRPHTASTTVAESKMSASRPGSARPRLRSASIWSASEATTVTRATLGIFCAIARNTANREHVIRSKVLDHIAARELYASPDKRVRRAVITLLTLLICTERKRRQVSSKTVCLEEDAPASSSESNQSSERDYHHYIELLARGVVKCLFGILAGDDFGMKVDALGALAQLTHDTPSRLTLCKPALLSALGQFAFHPLSSTRLHVAQIIANFAERPENVLKLVDAGLLPVLVRYVSPLDRSHAVGHSSDKGVSEALLVEATRALAAVSELHVARSRLVESGVLGALMRLIRAPINRPEVRSYAQSAVRNLRHDAAALRIQAIYRGWHVRTTFAGPRRRQNFRKLSMLVEAATAPIKQR